MDHPAGAAAIFTTAFMIGLSGAIMPGPFLAVVISETPRSGALTGPKMVVGHMILEAALVAALAGGLSVFFQNEVVIAVIALFGGLMLFWMGGGMIRSAKRLTLDVAAEDSGGKNPIIAGIVTSISNPYWTLWWATIGLAYIVAGLEYGIIGLVLFFAGHILSDFAWYSFISFGLARGKKLLNDKTYRGLIIICGVSLLFFGAWFFSDGVKKITAWL